MADEPEFALESAPCPLCGEIHAIPEWTAPDRLCGGPGTFTVARCLFCGLFRQEPRVPADRIGAYYPEDYIVYTRPAPAKSGAGRTGPWRRELLERKARRAVPGGLVKRALLRAFSWTPQARFNPVAVPGEGRRMLDIGCGIGNFAVEMQAMGWRVDGIEPNARAADVARERGLVVTTGHFPDAARGLEGGYDLVTMNQVIEHFTDPVSALAAARDLLAPGGRLVLWTPWRTGLCARVFRTYWFALEQPRHYVLFSPRDLQRAVNIAGLRTIWTLAHSSTASWTRSLVYSATGGPREALARRIDASRLVHRLLYWPLRLLDWWGLGDAGILVAEKPQ